MKQQYLPAGKIVSTHGLRGDVKILPWADSPEFLLDFDTVYLAGKPYTVEDARVQKTCVLMKLAGVDSVEAAARLRDVVVEIDRDDAELPEGSMFIQDLIGLPVLCEGKTLGKVKEILQLPANDVYVVEGEQEYMIPAVPEFILEMESAPAFFCCFADIDLPCRFPDKAGSCLSQDCCDCRNSTVHSMYICLAH